MAPKYTPITVILHFTGQKPKEEIQEIYSDFYIQNIRDRLVDSNLSDNERKMVIDRLIQHHSQPVEET